MRCNYRQAVYISNPINVFKDQMINASLIKTDYQLRRIIIFSKNLYLRWSAGVDLETNDMVITVIRRSANYIKFH